MTNIERITDMEQCFDRVDRALRALEEVVDTITSLEDDILKLDAYYSGDEWKADFRSDELGLLPQDLDHVDAFFGEKTWMDPQPMAESDVREKYEAVCEGIDALLLKHGYKREGRVYRALRPNHDCIALFCHFGVESVILSHMLNSSPMPLWHGFCALPSSITTVFTEERREGTASFRITEYGALPHLYLAGEEPSFSARFCECFTDDTRHD